MAGRDVHQVHCRPMAGASRYSMSHPTALECGGGTQCDGLGEGVM